MERGPTAAEPTSVFDLESLPTVLFERVLGRFLSTEYLCRATDRKLARVAELARRGGRLKAMDGRIRRLLKKSVHNEFHYEVKVFATKTGRPKLLELCTERLTAIEKLLCS